jgi:hypothetical protein
MPVLDLDQQTEATSATEEWSQLPAARFSKDAQHRLPGDAQQHPREDAGAP